MTIFAGPPDTSAQDRIAAQMGLHIVREPPRPVELWPEHWAAVELFEAMMTQWTIAPTGHRVGLRYEALVPLIELHGVPTEARRETFDCVRIMEAELLSHLADLQPRKPETLQ